MILHTPLESNQTEIPGYGWLFIVLGEPPLPPSTWSEEENYVKSVTWNSTNEMK